jgi:hypothetical protein
MGRGGSPPARRNRTAEQRRATKEGIPWRFWSERAATVKQGRRKLPWNINNIGVRSFILIGAPDKVIGFIVFYAEST